MGQFGDSFGTSFWHLFLTSRGRFCDTVGGSNVVSEAVLRLSAPACGLSASAVSSSVAAPGLAKSSGNRNHALGKSDLGSRRFSFPPGASAASAASAASCASEAMETLGRQDGGGHGSQGKGDGNAVFLRSCGSLSARVFVVVCPRLPVFVCGCAGARERLARSLSRARKAAQHETRFPFLINAGFENLLLFRTCV